MPDPAGTLHVDLRLRPCLAELLRTCIHPPTLLLRVEHVFGKVHVGSRRNAAVSHSSKQPHDGDRQPDRQFSSPDDSDPESDGDGKEEVRPPRSLHLALSDGVLQIQAVLAKQLHTEELGELQRGDLVKIRAFHLRSAARVSGHGKVIYIGVQHCSWVGRDQIAGKPYPEPSVAATAAAALDSNSEGGFIREEEAEMTRTKQPLKTSRTGVSGLSRRSVSDLSTSTKRGHLDDNEDGDGDGYGVSKKKRPALNQPATGPNPWSHPYPRQNSPSDDSDEDDWFETIPVSQSQVERRRESLRNNIGHHALARMHPNSTAVDVDEDDEAESDQLQSLRSATRNWDQGRVDQREDETGHQANQLSNNTDAGLATHPLEPQHPKQDEDQEPTSTGQQHGPSLSSLVPSAAPLHTLASLLHSASSSLPQRNYACTIFGVISWVSASLIHKPNTPFPPKRHIKVHDPSISHRQAGVTVAVFVDAKTFMPEVGTVALLRGVVMQRYQTDVILNKYNETSFGARSKEHGDVSDHPHSWFVSDQEILTEQGLDVQGMKDWWQARVARKKP